MSSAYQRWNAKDYARQARFVSDLGRPVLELLAPCTGERILDLGCGDGALTAELAAYGCAIVGVDASIEMVEAARSRGLDARVGEGERLQFEAEFDAVFSNAALRWMNQPERVIAGVRAALRPGGRFVGEFGGHGNVAAVVGALKSALAARGMEAPSPWNFPRPEDFGALLRAFAFDVGVLELIPRPTPLPGDLRGWLETFAQPYTERVPEADRCGFIAEIITALRGVLCDAQGRWWVDYVRLRFAATRRG